MTPIEKRFEKSCAGFEMKYFFVMDKAISSSSKRKGRVTMGKGDIIELLRHKRQDYGGWWRLLSTGEEFYGIDWSAIYPIHCNGLSVGRDHMLLRNPNINTTQEDNNEKQATSV